MNQKKILVVDDEPLMLEFVAETLRRQGHEIHTAFDGREAEKKLNDSFDLLITDLKMPHVDGLTLLARCRQNFSNCTVIMMTASASIESAVEAMQLGAFNYLLKPFSAETIEAVVKKAIDHSCLIKEHRFLQKELSSKFTMIATSSAMQQLTEQIKKVAPSHASVFIQGESGTGKEVIAHAIHTLSDRSERPFVKVNCAAIAETLVESEFFGHEKGSFTGAQVRKEGRFEVANGGTLLLDEITEIPLSLQPKLLRAIQEQEFERVGGSKPIRVNVRFISTSNRILSEAINKGIFREDLFYRLNVIPLHIPPLRQRREDILPLANHLEKFSLENHKPLKKLTPCAKQKLLSHKWPGNVRELANVLERAVVMENSSILEASMLWIESSFVKESSPTPLTLSAGRSLAAIEKEAILETMRFVNHNKTKAAQLLGIHIKTLRSKLNHYEREEKSSL